VVKGAIGGCDLVGIRDDDPSVIVVCELKLTFNLELILHSVDRASISDEVWIAAEMSARGTGRETDKRYRDLCRRLGIGDWGLGIGMLAVSEGGHVNVIVSSVSPMPRTNPKRRSRLVREHQRRVIPPSGVARVRLL